MMYGTCNISVIKNGLRISESNNFFDPLEMIRYSINIFSRKDIPKEIKNTFEKIIPNTG